MDPKRISYLFQRYEDDQITIPEKEEMYDLLRSFEDNDEILAWLENSYANTTPETINREQWHATVENILQETKVISFHPQKSKWKNWLVAASVIGLMGIGAYTFYQANLPEKNEQSIASIGDIQAPKTAKATITLADGSIVALDSIASGTIVVQGQTQVIKNVNGEIEYHYNDKINSSTIVYNTINNPRGSNIVNLTLADGTKVWLNTESSLRYPTAFSGNSRNVEIIGEAYFEVFHNPEKPFIVTANQTDITVIGTHFNINSYPDEPTMKTTLLEGKVKVKKGGQHVYLNPGQQSTISQNSTDIKIADDVDLEEVMAWKNGMIQFSGSNIGVIMRQIGRWYNIQTGYSGDAESAHLFGAVSRNQDLLMLIKVLEESGIEIKKENEKFIAYPKP